MLLLRAGVRVSQRVTIPPREGQRLAGDYCGPEHMPCHGMPDTGGLCPGCGVNYPPPVDWRRLMLPSDPYR